MRKCEEGGSHGKVISHLLAYYSVLEEESLDIAFEEEHAPAPIFRNIFEIMHRPFVLDY